MSFHTHPHAIVPFGSSLASASVDEAVRPNLRRAFPLPEHQAGDPRFRHLLEALLTQGASG
jgi:hypothetical protein